MLEPTRSIVGMADVRVRIVSQFRSRMQHCEIRCRACNRRVILPPEQAIATFGALTEVGALERRLVCQACGARGANVGGVYREYHG